jgi:iron complex transport system substrate-binding protein
MQRKFLPAILFAAGVLLWPAPPSIAAEVVDGAGRAVSVPDRVERVICSGPGCLRLLTYMQAEDRIVAVDDMEKTRPKFDARPYALANPQFKRFPIFGEFRGHDNPELILTLSPGPQVIFKTYPEMGHDPAELQAKTGIPVIVLQYGDLLDKRQDLYRSLRIMGRVLNREARAESVIAFFESEIDALKQRTGDVPEVRRKLCFVGGIAFKGPHGFQSTEPGYPPFEFVHAVNAASMENPADKGLRHSDVAKEKIVEWDPPLLFVDLSTLQMGDGAGGLYELRTDPAYRSLTAVENGAVYGLLPYNWYTQNFGSILANAYFVGKVLYPERFGDVDPVRKADAIYSFLVDGAVFPELDRAFRNLVFKKIPL